MSFVIEFFAEIVFEFGVKGLGYVILRYVFQVGRKKELDPDGWPVIVTGILAWAVIIVILIVAWKQLFGPDRPLEPIMRLSRIDFLSTNGSAA
jgi:hypothetical protein